VPTVEKHNRQFVSSRKERTEYAEAGCLKYAFCTVINLFPRAARSSCSRSQARIMQSIQCPILWVRFSKCETHLMKLIYSAKTRTYWALISSPKSTLRDNVTLWCIMETLDRKDHLPSCWKRCREGNVTST